MVQQTIDSKFSQYGMEKSETGFPHHDKQQQGPLAGKKTALRDLQNENRFTLPKTMGSAPFLKEGCATGETIKVSGIKRPALECLSTLHQQSASGNASGGHLVYVRRKPDAEFGKSSICENSRYNAEYQQMQKVGDQEEISQRFQVKESKISASGVAPIPMMSLSSGKPSGPPSPEISCKPVDCNYLSVKSAIPLSDYTKRITGQHWEERYCQLQRNLKLIDQSNQDDYVQLLRSLSSIELSKHAVDLERRSIQLSLEEAKEMQRVRILDVLGKYPKNCRAASTQEEQPEK